MANPSNLYAEKIYSEHPLVLWALDDQLDYISLITEAQRNIQNTWTVTDATATTSTTDLTEPFGESVLSLIEVDVPASESLEASIVSPNLLNFNTLDDLGTFTIGSYFYSNSIFLQSVSIGYEYTDPDTSQIVQNLKTFTSTLYQKWGFISETFEIPNVSAQLRIVFKIKIIEGSAAPTDNQFYFNGITLGQWNEEFNTYSLNGVTEITIPSGISLYSGLNAVEAQAYGIAEDSGYYMTDAGLKCKNTGIPLVYGASGATRIEGTEGASLIIPGKGFLNKKGQYNEYTVEFWARLNCKTSEPFKIFGPIASTDGLYVENGFLTLVIGNEFASHFVSEWFRPMLIHIRLIRDKATLLVNGEEVLSLFFNTSDLVLPDELDEFGDSQDWLGFYAAPFVYPFEIDCVAIYSYQVSSLIAKRRFVYGQGVPPSETIDSVYSGTTAFIDYSFANYTANYSYPDFAKWEQGTFDNLSSTKTYLRTPEYSLPEIFIGDKTIQELYDDNQQIQDNESVPAVENKFLSFRPNNSWNQVASYINFPKFNFLTNQTKSFYGVFTSHDLASEEILFKIYNPLTNDYFSIVKNADVIEYSLNYKGDTELIFTSDPITVNSFFAVGFDINTLSDNFGNNLPAFFGNQNVLRMYACGDESGQNSFTGKIWSIGFATERNTNKISDNFDSDGFVIFDNAEELIGHTASYTLLPFEVYGKYFLDIGISGYWQDYLPLSYFGQFVNNSSGEEFYDIDFLQFNLGYPSMFTLDLDSSSNYYYNTSGSEIKSYLTLQYLADGANIPTSFATEEQPNEYNIINIDDYEDWENTRFEILDNTLIYPTKSEDFNNLAVVYSLEFNSRRTLTKPILLNRLQLASQALNDNSFNPVGTRFGSDIFPYKRNGIYYDYKSKNPFSIYKGSTPYLYLTKTSGVEVRGELNFLENRGLSLPINKELSASYKISAAQLWLQYNREYFPTSATEIFEINHKNGKIKFYIQANSSSQDRAKIFAKDQNNLDYNGLAFYLDGKLVREPVLSINQWTSIGLSFLTPLVFNSYLGSINVTGPAVFNNISYYKASSVVEVESTTSRPWFKVLLDGSEVLNWQFWVNNDFTWDGMLILASSEFYGISPSDIYKTYMGTNKIIVDDNEGLLIRETRTTVRPNIFSVNVVTNPL